MRSAVRRQSSGVRLVTTTEHIGSWTGDPLLDAYLSAALETAANRSASNLLYCRKKAGIQNRGPAEQRRWMELQSTQPQRTFKIAELAILSGHPKRTVMAYLREKKVIPEEQTLKSGEHYVIELDVLTTKVPQFWRSIQSRIRAGMDSQ